ncbi:Poly(A) polymerase central domain-containing protein [Mycotypha africana]|uniref:Poly(A) polymerase central domain-containing protein n=1 Tax=Mycotypha africana TaxID=64632 RepID=UPI0023013FDB|nr:Poly(A) polymerase central domain-containing protein [Mycotypha africana]KAI8987576.1 Poly(A) polymerase central domain-containing protein [Mycotypha africana]
MTTTTTDITNEQWIAFLENNHIVETQEEALKRRRVINLLEKILPNFVESVLMDNPDNKFNPPTCHLAPFGSYALGGYTRSSDIDCVLLCPWSIRRQDFFQYFPRHLKKMATVLDVELVRRATVPIIKCVIDNISVDISFVRLRLPTIVKDNLDLLDDNLLEGIDPTCVASMDGPRVCQFIQSHIKPEHRLLFNSCLQIIKHWASQRQIYNKPLGYLNGSTWTLLLLKIYMTHRQAPNLDISQLLIRFYDTWADWPWPTPVLFTDKIPGRNQKLEYKMLKEFEEAVMPIVSPCYPVSNAAPYVTKSTKTIMTREFERASIILNTQVSPLKKLNKFFNAVNYFKRYHHFLTITTSCTTANNHEHWIRRMAHNIPVFIGLLEKSRFIRLMQPASKEITSIYNYRTHSEKEALRNNYTMEEVKSLQNTGIFTPGTLYLTYYFIGIEVEEGCKCVDLSDIVTAFLDVLKSKKQKNEDVHWHIQHMTKRRVAAILGVPTDERTNNTSKE